MIFPAATLLLIGAYCWNFGMGLIHVLLPLYAYHLKLSGVAIGSIISLPAILQIVLRLTAGTAADRWGEKKLLLWTYATIALAGPAFFLADSYLLLLAAQALPILSRATYWMSAQAAASRLPGAINLHLGRLNATNQAGAISGAVAAGFLVTQFGFERSFLAVTPLGLIALLACLLLPSSPGSSPSPEEPVLHHLSTFLRLRVMHFAILSAFVAALPSSLGQSFYPVLLSEAGFSPTLIGPLLAARSIGGIVAGLALARFLAPERRASISTAAVAGIALAVGLTPFAGHFLAMSLLLTGFGAASALMNLEQQLIASEASPQGGRATAMSVAGLGWSFSHIVVPMVFGLLADTLGLRLTFHAWGILMGLLAASMLPLYRRAFAPRPGLRRGQGGVSGQEDFLDL